MRGATTSSSSASRPAWSSPASEVKSARDGLVQIGQAYADVRDGEAWLIGASISEYAQGGPTGHQPDRDRKLLLHRDEIDSLYGKVREKGLTLVPTRMYFKDGRVKVEIALARGRERFDKRRVVAERDAQRDIDRALKSAAVARRRYGGRRQSLSPS